MLCARKQPASQQSHVCTGVRYMHPMGKYHSGGQNGYQHDAFASASPSPVSWVTAMHRPAQSAGKDGRAVSIGSSKAGWGIQTAGLSVRFAHSLRPES